MTAQELERDYQDYLEAWGFINPRHKPLTLAEYVVEAVLPEVRQAAGERLRFYWSE